MHITVGLGVTGLRNVQELYRSLVDYWYCFDGSMLPPELFAESSGDSVEPRTHQRMARIIPNDSNSPRP